MNLTEITNMALDFPVAERVQLSKALTESLDEVVDERLDELWRLELAERIRQRKNGEVEGIPAKEAHRIAKERVNEARRLSSTR